MIHVVETSRVVVVWWLGSPDEGDVEESVDRLKSHRSRQGFRPHYITVVSSDAMSPTPEGRSAFISNVDAVMAAVESMHIVLDANPFLNAVARGMVAAARVMPRFAGRVFLHPSLEGAIDALPGATTGATLRAAIENSTPPGSTPG